MMADLIAACLACFGTGYALALMLNPCKPQVLTPTPTDSYTDAVMSRLFFTKIEVLVTEAGLRNLSDFKYETMADSLRAVELLTRIVRLRKLDLSK